MGKRKADDEDAAREGRATRRTHRSFGATRELTRVRACAPCTYTLIYVTTFATRADSFLNAMGRLRSPIILEWSAAGCFVFFCIDRVNRFPVYELLTLPSGIYHFALKP